MPRISPVTGGRLLGFKVLVSSGEWWRAVSPVTTKVCFILVDGQLVLGFSVQSIKKLLLRLH